MKIMVMKRISLFLTAVCLFNFLLMGCNNSSSSSGKKDSSTQMSSKEDGNTGSAADSTQTGVIKQWEGTVTMCIPNVEDVPIYQKIGQAYMKLNPKVNIFVEAKDSAAYGDWLTSEMAGGKPTADIIAMNYGSMFIPEGKYVDYNQYLKQGNPYADNKIWMDCFEPGAYKPSGPNKEIYDICTDSVQILWFYNKDIFNKAGVQPPENWDQLVEACKKIKEAGYTPLAWGGDVQSLWVLTVGWLFRVYIDQYWKDIIPLVAVKEGDYNYDPDKHGKWTFDPQDINNDANSVYDYNIIRLAKMITDGEVGPDSDRFREMYENFAKVIPEYVPEGFFGLSAAGARDLFFSQKAAMWVDGADLALRIDKLMEKYPEDQRFELGYFWHPPMTGDLVSVDYTRALGGPQGFHGVVKKSKEQADLTMDFLMYFASPQGQQIKVNAYKELGRGIPGPLLVKNVELPEDWAKVFGNIGYKGECDLNPAQVFGRGFIDEQQSVREWIALLQKYFKGDMDVKEYSKKLQKVVTDAIPRWLKKQNYRDNALEDPSADPVLE